MYQESALLKTYYYNYYYYYSNSASHQYKEKGWNQKITKNSSFTKQQLVKRQSHDIYLSDPLPFTLNITAKLAKLQLTRGLRLKFQMKILPTAKMPQRCLQTPHAKGTVCCHGTYCIHGTWCTPFCRDRGRTHQDRNTATCRCQGCHYVVLLWVLTAIVRLQCRASLVCADAQAHTASEEDCELATSDSTRWSFFSFPPPLTVEQQHVAPGLDDLRVAPIGVILFVTLKVRKHTHTRTKHFLNHNSAGPPVETRSGGDAPAF